MTLPPLPLAGDEIHLWCLPYRRELGREPLRELLSGYLGLPPDAVQLTDSPHGRPKLQGQVLDFNWSHSGHWACVAVARQLPRLGVDIEVIRPRQRAAELARRFFSAVEAEWIGQAMDPSVRTQRFLDLWTAKEAVLKAHGRGLSYGLARAQFTMPGDAPVPSQFDGELGPATDWHLFTITGIEGCIGRLAWAGAGRRVLWRGLWKPSGNFPVNPHS